MRKHLSPTALLLLFVTFLLSCTTPLPQESPEQGNKKPKQVEASTPPSRAPTTPHETLSPALQKALALNNQGEKLLEQGKYPEALTLLQESLTIRKKELGEDHPDTASSYNNIGTTYGNMGDYAKAQEYQLKALTIIETNLGKNHPNTAISYNNVGATYNEMGDYAKAYQYNQKAFTIYLQNREKVFAALNTQHKAAFLQANQYYINILLDSATAYLSDLRQQGKQSEAELLLGEITNHWLAYKGSILDSDNQLKAFVSSSRDPAIQRDYQQLTAYQSQYARLTQANATSEQLEQLQQNINQLQYRIAKQNPRYQTTQQLGSITANTVANLLAPNELFLDFAKAGERYYLFTLTRDNSNFLAFTPETSQQIDSWIASFNSKTGNIQSIVQLIQSYGADTPIPENLRTQSRQALAALYNTLVDNSSLKEQLADNDSLIISPDGTLRLLPFEALYDQQNRQYLIEQKNIRYIASGRELVRVYQQRNQSTNSKAIVFANPNYGKTTKPRAGIQGITRDLPESFFPVAALEGTDAEARAIKQALNDTPTYYQGNDASEDQLLKTRQPSILHIATHGYFDADSVNPMLQSGILLAGANYSHANHLDEGIIPALKILEMDLQGTDLVVLSACETGKVDPDNTEGVSGLTKAFIQAGAKDVVMSLWSVADKETADLMSNFYKKAQANNSQYSQALRASKLEMIQQGLHPYYWAGFVLSGV